MKDSTSGGAAVSAEDRRRRLGWLKILEARQVKTLRATINCQRIKIKKKCGIITLSDALNKLMYMYKNAVDGDSQRAISAIMLLLFMVLICSLMCLKELFGFSF